MMGAFYYAQVDENGVLCVDQLDNSSHAWTEEQAADLAESYPDMIYFWYWAGDRSVILCTLCKVYGLGHDGDHLVPRAVS